MYAGSPIAGVSSSSPSPPNHEFETHRPLDLADYKDALELLIFSVRNYLHANAFMLHVRVELRDFGSYNLSPAVQTHFIKSKQTGICLNVDGSDFHGGGRIHMIPCFNVPFSQWQVISPNSFTAVLGPN